MELLAVIVALESLKKKGLDILITTDSRYVHDSVVKGWVFGWLKKGFKDKKNKDLWLRYLNVAKDFRIQFKWVKGHADNPFNNRCDELATAAADSHQLKIDEEYERENPH